MNMRILLLLAISLFLTACNSTPKRDDYTQHVNRQTDAISQDNFTFTFETKENFDIRGVYSQDSTIDDKPIMYSGAAGVAGMVAQIAAHAATSSAFQNSKLAQQQLEANNAVAEFIKLTEDFKNEDFIDNYKQFYVSTPEATTVFIKPIYFVNEKMNQVTVKAKVWIVDKKSKSRKPVYIYKNLVSVTSKVITNEQRQVIFSGGSEQLRKHFSGLLGNLIELAQSELAFSFKNSNAKEASHIVLVNGKNKLIRGKVVAQDCQYTTIQNTRKWLLRYANELLNNWQSCEQSVQNSVAI